MSDSDPEVIALGRLVWETTALFDALPTTLPARARDWADLLQTAREVRFDGGGAAANVAAALGRRGRRATFVGQVGDDPPGRTALEALAWACVDARVRVLPGRSTPRTLRLKESGTDRGTFVADRPEPTVPPLEPGEIPEDVVAGARLLVLDRASRAGLAAAQRRGPGRTALILQQAPRDREARDRLAGLLPLLSLVQVRGDAAGELAPWLGMPAEAGAVVEALARRAEWAVVTLGPEGAVACTRGGTPFVVDPVPPPIFLDSTGAGDAFFGRLVEGWLDGAPLEEACARGARAASDACGWLGARALS